MEAAVIFDLVIMNGEYFCYRQVDAFRHLLAAGQLLVQLPVLLVAAARSFHHFTTDEALGWNYLVQIEFQRALEKKPLVLPILLGNRNKFLVELRIDFRSKLLGLRGWHGLPPPRRDC